MDFNYILDEYPSKLLINNKYYQIKSDFKNILKIDKLYKDKTFTNVEKHFIALKLFYVDEVFEDEFISAMFDFIACYKKSKKASKLLDLYKDSQYIYTAFIKEYNLDLSVCNMHWFKFMALFEELDNVLIKQIINIRDTKITPNMDKQEKERLLKLKRLFSLDNNDNHFIKMLERRDNG